MSAATGDPLVDDARRRGDRRIVLGMIAAMFVVAAVVIAVPTEEPLTIDVVTLDAKVENGHFNFERMGQSRPGWTVWLTLDNRQTLESDSTTQIGTSQSPGIVSRYQLKLSEHCRVRVPLEYLPTTDEGLGQMRASFKQNEDKHSILRPDTTASLLSYMTESHMKVRVQLMMLPVGQTPDSLLDSQPTGLPRSPRYKTIEPPAQPKLGPFEGAYDQGKVELVVLGPHPSKDQPCWKPNGEVSVIEIVPEHNGKSSAAGKVIKEIVVRVHSQTGLASAPVLRFAEKSQFSGMGTSFHRPDEKHSYATMIQTIACPPDARQMTVEVGVAEGDWRTEITFDCHTNQNHFALSSHLANGTTWEGSVRKTIVPGDTVALAFNYTRSNEHETRLVYERADGSIERMKEEGSNGGHGLINSLTTLPLKEFETIRKFHVQSRRYQWVEFRNVSLELGHRTKVEVQSAR